MDAIQYIQARLRRGVQTLVYLAVVIGLLLLSGWLVMGTTGVFTLLAFSAVLLLVPTSLPISVLMRMRGARPLHPAEAPLLHHIVATLARRAGLSRVPSLYLQAGAELQAFTVASGNRSAIGVTPALLRGLDADEIAGVLAHEMSHIQSGDTRVMGFAQALRRLTHSLATLAFFLIPVALIFGEAVPVSPLALGILLFAPTVSYLAELGLSRTREYNADLAAARLTGDPQALARALHKLEHHQQGLLALFFGSGGDLRIPEALRTHPPTRVRVQRLLELTPRQVSSGPRRPLAPGPSPSRFGASSPRTNSDRRSVTMM